MNPIQILQRTGLHKVIDYLYKDPANNALKVMDWVDKFSGDGPGNYESQRHTIRRVLMDPENNYYQYIMGLFEDLAEDQFRKLIDNFFFDANLIGGKKIAKNREKYGCNIPWAILMDPTSACNRHCVGCWAAEYGNKLNLTFDDLDSIITQGKELGIYMYIYTGGEPTVRKDDLMALCKKHDDAVFLCFTNGDLFDEEFVEKLAEVKNFVPAFSIEGDREVTDSRRGEGAYDSVHRAMALMKKHKLLFGASCCYTSQNMYSITSSDFVDDLTDEGCKFIWYFHYMPVGNDATTDLLLTPDQREIVFRRLRKIRYTKPQFIMDFQNDAEYVQGCIAGGRKYLHINANGDVDPCVFIHYSDSNIHDKSLLECLQSPLFMAYHDGQPFNDNMLRPCPMLENPGKIRDIIHETGAKSTDLQSPEAVDDLIAKTVDYAKAWAPRAKELWADRMEERKENAKLFEREKEEWAKDKEEKGA